MGKQWVVGSVALAALILVAGIILLLTSTR
jgi:hypothetical protein